MVSRAYRTVSRALHAYEFMWKASLLDLVNDEMYVDYMHNVNYTH